MGAEKRVCEGGKMKTKCTGFAGRDGKLVNISYCDKHKKIGQLRDLFFERKSFFNFGNERQLLAINEELKDLERCVGTSYSAL